MNSIWFVNKILEEEEQKKGRKHERFGNAEVNNTNRKGVVSDGSMRLTG